MIRAESGPATNWPLVIAAVVVLVGGTLVYVLDRPANLVPFFSAISLHGLIPTDPPYGKCIPAFLSTKCFLRLGEQR